MTQPTVPIVSIDLWVQFQELPNEADDDDDDDDDLLGSKRAGSWMNSLRGGGGAFLREEKSWDSVNWRQVIASHYHCRFITNFSFVTLNERLCCCLVLVSVLVSVPASFRVRALVCFSIEKRSIDFSGSIKLITSNNETNKRQPNKWLFPWPARSRPSGLGTLPEIIAPISLTTGHSLVSGGEAIWAGFI